MLLNRLRSAVWSRGANNRNRFHNFPLPYPKMPESTADQLHPQRDQAPCRTCVDFKTWSRQTRAALSGTTGSKSVSAETKAEIERPRRPDCPLDKDDLGRATWGLLHTMAAHYPEKPSTQQAQDVQSFFTLLGRLYPCEYCAKDLQTEVKKDPPRVESQHELSQWLCRLHNKVNLKLGKPVFDCSQVNQRWRDGWLDGSCD